MNASVEYLMHVVLSHTWPPLKHPSPFIGFIPYPPMVFPIFSALLYGHVLATGEESDAHFDSTLSVIVQELPSITATASERILTTLALILLLKYCSHIYQFEEKKRDALLAELERIFDHQITKLIQPSLIRAEILVNRFSTANFEFDNLLLDFKDVLRMCRGSLKMSDTLNRTIMERFVYLLEYRLMNKLLENPSRFNFTNGMVWNSFLTALESDERISMKSLRGVISTFVMAPNIATAPEMTREICPTLPPIVVAFILQNYHQDANVPEAIKAGAFLKAHKIKSVPEVLDKLEPVDKASDSLAFQSAKLHNWSVCREDEELLTHYSFMREYASKS